MYTIRRILYYIRSIYTLMSGVRNPGAMSGLLRARRPVVLLLVDGSQYHVKTLMDAWIVKETVLDRDYERYGVPLQDGWTVLDVGAAAGDFTVYAARRVPHGRVVAFEPAPDSVEMLRLNVAANRLTNVDIKPVAVGAEDDIAVLDVSGGIAVQYRTAGVKEAGPDRVAVGSVSLARVLAELPGGRCDFLKIDVEGAEYEILFSLDDATLERISRICMEYHEGVTPYTHTDLVRFLQAKGWTVRVSPSRVRRELGFIYAQAPAVYPQSH